MIIKEEFISQIINIKKKNIKKIDLRKNLYKNNLHHLHLLDLIQDLQKAIVIQNNQIHLHQVEILYNQILKTAQKMLVIINIKKGKNLEGNILIN